MAENPTESIIEEPKPKKTAKAIISLLVIVFYIYIAVAFLIFTPYYNWKYAQENGFWNWIFLGEIVPTAKALAWPYFAFFSGTKEIKWTDEEKQSLQHFKSSIDASNTIGSLSNSTKLSETTPDTVRDQLLPLTRIAFNEARQVSDQVLVKLHPDFKDHFRNEYQKGMELLMTGLESRDKVKVEDGVNAYQKFVEWLQKHATEFPPDLPK